MDIDWTTLWINAGLVFAFYLAGELLFWIINTVIFKALFGQKPVPHFIGRIRTIGYRLGFVSLLLGCNFNTFQNAVQGGFPSFKIKPVWLQLSALFFVVATVIYLLGMWLKKVERKRL